jgi:hypothetical protein
MEDSVFGYALFVVGCLFALLALIIVVLNYSALYTSHRNKKRGIGHRPSMIFLVPQILLILANIIFQSVPVYPVSGWLLLGIALSDPGIWLLIALPVVMRLKK